MYQQFLRLQLSLKIKNACEEASSPAQLQFLNRHVEYWSITPSVGSTVPAATRQSFFLEGLRNRYYGRTAALRLIVQPVMKMKRKMISFFFSFFQVMEHRWNESDRGKPKHSGKTLSQRHFFHHKSHMDRSGIEPGPPRWETGD